MRYDLSDDFNLKQKFDGQLTAFTNMGFNTFFIAFDRKYFYLVNGNSKKIIGKTHFCIPAYIHTLFYIDFNKVVSKIMKKIKWDYIYWRSAPCCFTSYYAACAIHNNGAKIVYEFPTFLSVRERQLNIYREIFSLYSNFWQNKINKLVDCFVMMGEDAHGEYKGKMAINISNGIDVESVPLRKPQTDLKTVHLLALASMCYWHGYDRIIKSLAKYEGKQPVILHMVGGNDGGMLNEWKQLTKDLNLEKQVIFHGQLSGEELAEIFNLCDLGINSLGLYRKSLYKTSELKAREYAARGLPFVRAVMDDMLDTSDELYWISVTNDDTIPDMQEIVDFAMDMRLHPDSIVKLREFAKDNMTWEAQYVKIFERL